MDTQTHEAASAPIGTVSGAGPDTVKITGPAYNQPAPAPNGAGYIGAAPYAAPQQAPRRGMGIVAIILIGVFGILAAGAVATFAFGWFAIDRAISSIPTVQLGPLVSEEHSVPVGSASIIHADVQMGAGSLTLDGTGTASNAFEGKFEYNVPDWQPQVSYDASSGNLNIHQAHENAIVKGANKDVTNNWTLHMNKGKPLALNAQMGAGDTKLNLNGLEISGLYVQTGASNLTIDLSGSRWTPGVLGTIQGGAGNTTIILPKETGARVKVEGGLSNISADGFARSGNDYTNAQYGKSGSSVEITVQIGVGNVTLQQR